MSLPLNTWLSVPNTWRPNNVARSTCLAFVFHHIRPASYKVELAEYSGEHRNGARIIAPGQVSMILAVKPGFFQCVTIVSGHIDHTKLYNGNDYARFLDSGDAGLWYLSAANLFQGPWEAFNGPNPISIA